MSDRRGPRRVADRLRRLLVVLPWLMERGSATLGEMSQRFELSEAELVRDLELAAMCGLPPFLDEMIDLFIDDDGTVNVGIPRFFARPLRLTAPEGFTLLAAGRLAMALPGAEPTGSLGRALTKLEVVLGDDAMAVDVPSPPATLDLIGAAERGERVQIAYWSASSDEATERMITPRLVFADRGRWYVVADDDRSGERRRFRIDRIASCQLTGELVDLQPVPEYAPDSWFDDAPELAVATLRLNQSGRWAVERLPLRSMNDDGDHVIVEVAVASERWLAELLLRLGSDAMVLAPGHWVDLAARTAQALLAECYAVTS